MNCMLNHNFTPLQVIERMHICRQALESRSIEINKLGIKKAEAEKSYRIALRKEVTKLRFEKYPATLTQDLARGNEEVAKLKLERDVAESTYFTAISARNNLELEIEILRSQLSWLKTEYQNS